MTVLPSGVKQRFPFLYTVPIKLENCKKNTVNYQIIQNTSKSLLRKQILALQLVLVCFGTTSTKKHQNSPVAF